MTKSPLKILKAPRTSPSFPLGIYKNLILIFLPLTLYLPPCNPVRSFSQPQTPIVPPAQYCLESPILWLIRTQKTPNFLYFWWVPLPLPSRFLFDSLPISNTRHARRFFFSNFLLPFGFFFNIFHLCFFFLWNYVCTFVCWKGILNNRKDTNVITCVSDF